MPPHPTPPTPPTPPSTPDAQPSDSSPAPEIPRALLDPAVYPDAPDTVSHIQTHISHVFLAGDLVYKVKKPVTLDFIDFSTPDLRRRYCLDELRLNRRLAPDTYRRVLPIVRTEQGAIRILPAPIDPQSRVGTDPPGTFDYALEMLRLPEDGMMTTLLERNALTTEQIRDLASLLADFHARADRSPEIDRTASPDAIARRIRANLDDLEHLAGPIPDAPAPGAPILSPAALIHLRRWFDAQLDTHRPLMRARIRDRRARDGHGDLHSGNICLTEGGWVVFDCIEFSDALRYLDTAAELAFLAMDLRHRGHAALAHALLDAYARDADDPGLFELQSLYQTHYGLVRAKVDAIAARQLTSDPDAALAKWRAAASFAADVAAPTLAPTLIVLTGLPATGKSHAARAIAHPFDAELLQSDRLRKALPGLDAQSLYSDAATDRTYAELASRTERALGEGRSVIADATHPSPERRLSTLDAAPRACARAVIVHTTCDEPTIARRMAARAHDPTEISDADIEVYRRARESYTPPSHDTDAAPIVVSGPDTDPGILALRVIDTASRHPPTSTTR